MRFAIFADIHSNLEAFSAVIEALKNEGIDIYFCAGDVVGYAADPIECIALLKQINAVTVSGNHEWAALDLLDISSFSPNAATAIKWTRHVLGKEDFSFLKEFKLLFKNNFLTIVHGSPDTPEVFKYLYEVDDAAGSFELLDTQLCFIGHTHRPGVFIKEKKNLAFVKDQIIFLDNNCKYIINVGSVGQPRDGDRRACFCIYDTEKKQIVFRRISYDIKQAQKKILKAGLPERLAYRLEEGL